MINKLILLAAIIVLFIGIVFIFLAREIIRNRKNINNENVAVRNLKVLGFVIVVISFIAIYFCKLGGI